MRRPVGATLRMWRGTHSDKHGMIDPPSTGVAPLPSVMLGRICCVVCLVISWGREGERGMAKLKIRDTEARSADGTAPPCARRTMMLGIA